MHVVVRLKSRSAKTAKLNMGLFRTFRPISVEARQSTKAETIATDLGFTNVNPGDWVIRGEGGESYILNNDFFQRTFTPIEEQQLSPESRGSLEQRYPVIAKTVLNPPMRITRHRLRVCARRNRKVKQSL
jgi:hypothetical protein